MARRKEKPTLENARMNYWNKITEWEFTRTDPYSTWWQMRDAAQAVDDAKSDWYAAAYAATPSYLSKADRRHQADETLSEDIDPNGYPRRARAEWEY